MPITVTIAPEPSGRRRRPRRRQPSPRSLLNHAGFRLRQRLARAPPANRLPTSMKPRGTGGPSPPHAAPRCFAAARYTPSNSTPLLAPLFPPTRRVRSPSAAQVLALTDRIRGGRERRRAGGRGRPQSFTPSTAFWRRVREALEAAGEQVTDLDDEAYQLADRFRASPPSSSARRSPNWSARTGNCAVPPCRRRSVRLRVSASVQDFPSRAALATSPAATQAIGPPGTPPPSSPAAAPPVGPARNFRLPDPVTGDALHARPPPPSSFRRPDTPVYLMRSADALASTDGHLRHPRCWC